MADGYDGSIVIDTEIDREGFEQGAEKLYSAIKNLCGEIKNFGAVMGKSMSAAIEAIRGLSQNTEAIYEKLGTGATQATDANARLVSSMNDARQSVTGAARAASAYDSALAKTQKQIDAQKAKLSEYYKQVAEIKASTDKVLAQTTTDEQTATVLEIEKIELQKLNDKYAAHLGTLKELEAEYQRLAAAQAQSRQNENTAPAYNANDVRTVAADIEKASRAVDRYQGKVDKMRAVGASDRAWQSTRYDIAQATAQLQEYRRNLDALQVSGKISPEDYERLSSALDTATAKAQQLSASTQGLSPFREKLQQIGAAALRTAANLAKMPFQVAGKGIKALSNSVSNFIKNSKGARLQANALVKALTSLKRLLITRIKRMFISSIFNSAKESLQTLAKFSDSFNSAMSNIKNSAKQLSGNLAVSFGGLIQQLEPAITAFINMLSRAISYVNAFFALLGGRSTMIVAKKQTDDYAKSLAGAGGAAEELKRQVYGFDELNKRSDDSNGGGGGADGSDPFDEVPIDSVLPEKLRALFDELKELWENEQFFDFGARIGEAFNSVIVTVDGWINNTFRPKGVEWAENIALIFNGLVNGVNWGALGKTLADGLNAIFDIVSTFFSKISIKAIVQAIEDFFASALQTVNPAALLAVFLMPNILNAVKAMIAKHSIATLVIGALLALGPKLGDTLKQMVSTIRDEMGKAFSDGLVWALNRLSEEIESVDWHEFTVSLLDGLKTALRNVEWDSVGSALAELLGAAFGAIAGAVVSLAQNIWTTLIGALEAVKTYFERYFKTYGGDIIAGLWAGIKNALSSVDTWIRKNIFDPIIKGFKKAFGIASPSTVMKEMGSYIVEGLLQGIKDTWDSIVQFFDTAIQQLTSALEAAWNAIQTGASTAWGNIKSAVTQQFDALRTGITSAASNIKSTLSTTWESVKSTASTTWESIKSTAGTAWDGIKNAVTQSFNTAKTNITNTANNIRTMLTSTWEGVRNTTVTTWENTRTAVAQKIDALKIGAANAANDTKVALSTAWDGIKSTAVSTWDAISSTVSQKFDSLKRSVTSQVDALKTDLSAAWRGIEQTAETSWNKITSTATTAWSNLSSTVSGLWNSLKSTLSQTDWSSIGSNLVSGLNAGIQSAKSTVVSSVSSLASSLISKAKNALGIRSPSTVFAEIGKYVDMGLIKGVDGYEKNVLQTVSGLAKDVSEQFAVEDATIRIGTEIGGISSELGRTAQILTGIAETFWNIRTALTGIGGLEIPAIAAGTVVPPRTMIADALGDPFESPRFDAFTSDVDERLSDLTYLLRRILELLEHTDLGLDVNELSRALAFALQSRVIGYGL